MLKKSIPKSIKLHYVPKQRIFKWIGWFDLIDIRCFKKKLIALGLSTRLIKN